MAKTQISQPTQHDLKVLEIIRHFKADYNGNTPGTRYIAQALGVQVGYAVDGSLKRLVRFGLLIRHEPENNNPVYTLPGEVYTQTEARNDLQTA